MQENPQIAGPSLVPGLLDPSPADRIDVEQTRQSMSLAFASGVSGGLFSDVLDRASHARSTWAPASFAADLFVQSFVTSCFKVKAGDADIVLHTNHLVNVLTHPPCDREVIDYRRAIARELRESPALRASLEGLYAALCRFRAMFEGATGLGRWDANRRQLDILTLGKQIVDLMAGGFADARSGLRRLSAFGQEVKTSEPYRALADLLRYDEELATVNLNVSIGADGRIRQLTILSVKESSQNPFVASAPRRWLAKLELFARGFRFGDGEVMSRLIDAIYDGVDATFVRLVPLVGEIEVYLGALGFCDAAEARGLGVCLPELVGADQPRSLEGLFNPLLLGAGVTPVPCDLRLDRHDTITLITGPNSGGKTRLLQSIGLTELLAQSGLFVPARAASLALAPALVVSLIQDTKADQAEGRLGMELMRIRELFERLPPGAMVILDELCSGTNPSEGEEIFELVVRMLTRLAPQAFITTHFLAFAGRLEGERAIDELRFLQVALGAEQQPTYQFTPGVAKTSLAGHTAARLGVTGDQLMSLIEKSIGQAAPTEGRG